MLQQHVELSVVFHKLPDFPYTLQSLGFYEGVSYG